MAADGCDPGFRFMYDLDLFLWISLACDAGILGDSSQWTYYRRHGGQMSRQWPEMAVEWERLLAKMAALKARDSLLRPGLCCWALSGPFSKVPPDK